MGKLFLNTFSLKHLFGVKNLESIDGHNFREWQITSNSVYAWMLGAIFWGDSLILNHHVRGHQPAGSGRDLICPDIWIFVGSTPHPMTVARPLSHQWWLLCGDCCFEDNPQWYVVSSLPKTNSQDPQKIGNRPCPKRKRSSSNHDFSEANF